MRDEYSDDIAGMILVVLIVVIWSFGAGLLARGYCPGGREALLAGMGMLVSGATGAAVRTPINRMMPFTNAIAGMVSGLFAGILLGVLPSILANSLGAYIHRMIFGAITCPF